MYALIVFYLYFGGLTTAHVELFESKAACEKQAAKVYARAIAEDKAGGLVATCIEPD